MLFVCNKCGCVDMAELAFDGAVPAQAEEQLCTMCQTGTWHGQFEQRPYDPKTDLVVNRETGISLG